MSDAYPWQATVMRGDAELYVSDWYVTEEDARAEAQQFIDKLTAPFAPKGK